jgi:hypothetical protein
VLPEWPLPGLANKGHDLIIAAEGAFRLFPAIMRSFENRHIAVLPGNLRAGLFRAAD